MTRVLILGQPLTAVRIARVLNLESPRVQAEVVPTRRYGSLLAAPPRSGRTVLMRVGFRIGSASARGRAFDAYWSLLRRVMPDSLACHYWIGTDVMDTIEDACSGTLRWQALASTRGDLHLAVAPWLATELEAVGLHPITALLPPTQPAPRTVPAMPSEFTVLTYIPAGLLEFYGGPTIFEAARRMPGVRFDVLGRQGEGPRPSTANVHWHGWVQGMSRMYAQASVVVRLPRHDGFGNTVIEGLLHARHVIYTQDIPFVRQIRPVTADGVVAALGELADAHARGQLGPNLAGREYALELFEPEGLARNLANLLDASPWRAAEVGTGGVLPGTRGDGTR